MEFFVNLMVVSFEKVWVSFTHNWIFLLASVLISVALKLYMRPEKISAWLTRYSKVGVLGATAAAVTTPFCSCGTTAVVLGMVASTVPWAPIVAFMVASPLTSPQELVYSAGIFGWPFAIAFFVSSILLGLLGGALAEIFEKRGWLANQARFALQSVSTAAAAPRPAAAPARVASLKLAPAAAFAGSCGCGSPAQVSSADTDCGCGSAAAAPAENAGCGCGSTAATPAANTDCGCGPVAAAPVADSGCGCGANTPAPAAAACACGSTAAAPAAATPCGCGSTAAAQENPAAKITWRQWLREIYQTGGKLLLMFLGFAFLGYLLNGLIPQAWIAAIFGQGNIYSVPLAATLGLPFYINTEGSLPLVRALIDGGMSQGAALAFLITGAGTSIGAVGGALTIAHWRVIALVVGTLWVGSVILGFAYDLLLAAHLF